MSTDVRSCFSDVEKIVQLMLVCPCSSTEAECSFSSLWCLKTWLRSTMTQTRLKCLHLSNMTMKKLEVFKVQMVLPSIIEHALDAVEVAGCCKLSKDLVLIKKHKPGAIWHIYKAEDSDKICWLLKKVIFI